MSIENRSTTGYAGFEGTGAASNGSDAVARYQYLLRTASPDQIEAAHQQAFAAMSEEERQQVLRALSRAGADTTDTSSSALARSATRLEMTNPGSLQDTLGSAVSSRGGTLLGGIAIGVAGSAIMNALFDTGGRPGLVRRLLGGGIGGWDSRPSMGASGMLGGLFGGGMHQRGHGPGLIGGGPPPMGGNGPGGGPGGFSGGPRGGGPGGGGPGGF